MSRPIPPQLIDAFNNSVPPFDKDIVTADSVRRWFGAHLHVYPSDRMITLWLVESPFNGQRIQFWDGMKPCRAIILRGSWMAASGRAIMEYLASARDPLCD